LQGCSTIRAHRILVVDLIAARRAGGHFFENPCVVLKLLLKEADYLDFAGDGMQTIRQLLLIGGQTHFFR
jgi:hypothetical protein